ncbi:MAG: hypothetical protein LBB94_03885 [Clostridiales bacterium]|jgi:hypothetical protein|nr:hypothetical protein [Clostridiales bacterium]
MIKWKRVQNGHYESNLTYWDERSRSNSPVYEIMRQKFQINGVYSWHTVFKGNGTFNFYDKLKEAKDAIDTMYVTGWTHCLRSDGYVN